MIFPIKIHVHSVIGSVRYNKSYLSLYIYCLYLLHNTRQIIYIIRRKSRRIHQQYRGNNFVAPDYYNFPTGVVPNTAWYGEIISQNGSNLILSTFHSRDSKFKHRGVICFSCREISQNGKSILTLNTRQNIRVRMCMKTAFMRSYCRIFQCWPPFIR